MGTYSGEIRAAGNSRRGENLEEWRRNFRDLDANGDGKLSVEEVHRVATVLMRRTPGSDGWREAAEMVSEADDDGDGFIDLHEFLRLKRRMSASRSKQKQQQQQSQSLHQQQPQQSQSLHQQQQQQSQSRQQQQQPQEVRPAPKRGSEPDQPSRYDHDADVDDADADDDRADDDVVDDDVGDADDDDDDDDEVLLDAFEVFDANRDGHITAEELHAVLVQLGGIGGGPRAFGAAATSASTSAAPATSAPPAPASLQECHRMIRAVDRSGAGYVDFRDFKRMMSMAIP